MSFIAKSRGERGERTKQAGFAKLVRVHWAATTVTAIFATRPESSTA